MLKTLALATTFLLVLFTQGCAAPGKICDELPSKGKCYDDQHALFCLNGKYAKVRCRDGCDFRLVPRSLQSGFAKTNCEIPHAINLPCVVNEQVRCADDRSAVLQCEDFKWKQVLACEEKSGCSMGSLAYLTCDSKKLPVGKPCPNHASPNILGCAADNMSFLKCTFSDPVLKVNRVCRGPKGCRDSQGLNIACDQSLAKPGDICGDRESGYNGRYSCSMDGKSLLLCQQDFKYKLHETCPNGCEYLGGHKARCKEGEQAK